jgi:hypothetical protein
VDRVNGIDDLEQDLRRVLRDPALRLSDSVVPLDRVHAGARRRQVRRRALASTAGAAVVLVVAGALGGPWSPLHGAAPSGGAPSGSSPTPSGSPEPTSAAPSPSPSAAAVTTVAHVLSDVVSVTATGSDHWWVLGADGGIAATTDGGRTFTLVGGPGTGAVELRFAVDGTHGWAVTSTGGAGSSHLLATSDAGARWHDVHLAGTVSSVEATGSQVFGVVHARAGRWQLWAATVGDDASWHSVADLPGLVDAPHLAIQSGRAIVVGRTGTTSRGWVLGTDGHGSAYPAPCDPALGVEDLSATVGSVWLVCPTGMQDSLYVSDAGAGWTAVPVHGGRLRAGGIDADHAAVGLEDGTIVLTDRHGTTTTARTPAHRMNEWAFLGFTNAEDGFALDGGGSLLRTTDGGRSWSTVRA